MIEARGAITAYMRLEREGQSVGAEFRVTSVQSPILSKVKLDNRGFVFEAGPGARSQRENCSVTLDVVKNPLFVNVKA